jgi:serine/threonine-protein kinase
MIYPGFKIGVYRIEDEIGRGGFGSVYLARDESAGSKVAIKLLHPKILASEDARQSFIDEMINQARLSLNPNVVHIVKSIRYVDGQGEHLGMVMEYVDGESLDYFIQRYSLLPDYVAVPIFIQILNGLDFAHRYSILHRDIKPGNILIRRDGLVKIMDFGLSKMINTSVAASESARAASLNYVAPERLRRESIDQRTDIYSLGATFYEALTGEPPYDIEPGDWKDAEAKHSGGRFKSICDFYQGHSRELEAIVAKALDPDAGRRYATCRDMIADLARLNGRLTVPDKSDPRFKPIRETAERILRENGSDVPRPAAEKPVRDSVRDEDALFEKARESRASEDFRKYLEKHPRGRHMKEAQEAIRELELKPLEPAHEEPPAEPEPPSTAPPTGPDLHFSAGERRPRRKGLWIVFASVVLIALAVWGAVSATGSFRTRDDNMKWERALREDSLSWYQWYLEECPEGRHRAEALKKMDDLRSGGAIRE